MLAHINLAAKPVKTVAFLGATGAGTPSQVNLFSRFYDLSARSVVIDGVDTRTVQQDSLLVHIGILPHDKILFSGMMCDHICNGKPEPARGNNRNSQSRPGA